MISAIKSEPIRDDEFVQYMEDDSDERYASTEEDDLLIETDDRNFSSVRSPDIKKEPDEEDSKYKVAVKTENEEVSYWDMEHARIPVLRIRTPHNMLNHVPHAQRKMIQQETTDETRNVVTLEIPQNETASNTTDTTNSILCSNITNSSDWPGLYRFNIGIQYFGSSQLRKNWEFSEKLNKVYITMNSNLPVEFKWDECESDLYVRATMRYTLPNDMPFPVRRCPNHGQPTESSNIDFPFVGHVVRCVNNDSIYEEDPRTGHLSVLTPLDTPQPGTESVVGLYKFMCLTSCSSGMNRRPVHVIFTLERKNGDVLGRRSLNVKICSCVSRDKAKEELSKGKAGRKKFLVEKQNDVDMKSCEVSECPVKNDVYMQKPSYLDITTDSHIACMYDNQWFFGLVLRDLGENDVEVKFLHPYGAATSFHRPTEGKEGIKIIGLDRYRKCSALLHDMILGESLRTGSKFSDEELQMLDELKIAASG